MSHRTYHDPLHGAIRLDRDDPAEAMALDEARHNGVRPDTAVVTLEPCSTPKGQDGKKTPPCAAALIEAGV